ncbi:MAG TPA: LLM class F420-dependent oxidoreductase [Sporichthyaceae bacterium]|jgi:F420-dependent oxidoreductase-like protein
MKLAMLVPYAGDVKSTIDLVVALEAAGLDQVFVPEAYSFDAISTVGAIAALTSRIEIGTGVLNVYSRTPALLGMTAAGCDAISNGRFILGLGASGPQVIEGFHAVPYDTPLARIRETIEVVRMILRREVLEYDGKALHIPLPAGQGTGLAKPLKLINHPVRSNVPIWWASLMPKAVQATAEVADGWVPVFFLPERADVVWGDALRAGLAKRPAELGTLQIVAGGPAAIGDDAPVEVARGAVRKQAALYLGGMGARGKNFYNTVATQYGWGDEAREVQDLYLDGKKAEAAAALPADLVDGLHLVGPKGYVAERIAAYRQAGVTSLFVEPVEGTDPVRMIAAMRELIDA